MGRRALIALVLFTTAAAAGERPLLLEIWINGRTNHVVAAIDDRGGALWARVDDLSAAGLKVTRRQADGRGMVPLDALGGVTARLDSGEQKLQVTAPETQLAPQVFHIRTQPPPVTPTSDYGAIAAYSLAFTDGNLSRFSGNAGFGAEIDGTLFSPWATLTTNGLLKDDPAIRRAVRLDSAFEADDTDSLRRWVVGDAISGGLDWSRPLRFGGLQIATDFSLRPDMVTMPLPAFFGSTAVPSTVDVFVNAAHVFEADVEPGPFQIDNIPVVTGSGQASIVVRDALGQQTTVTLPYFASDALLQKGLSAYDIDIGALRENYGIESFDYGRAMAMGTIRYGATDWLTLEAHGEAAQAVQLAGVGAAFSLGHFGVAQLAASGSNSNEPGRGGRGALLSASVDTQWRPVGFFASVISTTGRYQDVAALDAPPPPSLQMQFGANLGLGQAGSFTGSFIEVRRAGEEASRLATGSYALPLNRWFFGATGFYDFIDRNWAAELFLSFALDNGALAQGSVRSGSGAMNEAQAGLIKGADPDGGFGYRLSATAGDIETREAEATWVTPAGTIDGAVSDVNGSVATRVLATGALVAMDHGIYATQWPNGSVALVKTGRPGAHVFRENRDVAVADSDGNALLSGLTPYTENRISIDPNDYALTTIVGTTQKIVAPRGRSGVIVDLAPVEHHPALLVLRMEDGAVPPTGAAVTVDDADGKLVVGRGGEVFVGDMKRAVEGTITLANGACRFIAAPPAVWSSDKIPRLGPITCRKDAI
jgi:outer membrane usher protein